MSCQPPKKHHYRKQSPSAGSANSSYVIEVRWRGVWKGPGLDTFPLTAAGALRICINESLLHVPAATYFFAYDEGPIARVAMNWPPQCISILEPKRAELARSKGLPANMIVTYHKRQADSASLKLSPPKIAEQRILYGNSGIQEFVAIVKVCSRRSNFRMSLMSLIAISINLEHE
jgi:hypothetical protein